MQLVTDILIFRDNEPIHFQTRYEKKKNQIEVRRSWDIEISKDKAAARYEELNLSLLDRVPWQHLKESITTKNYDFLSIANFSSRSEGQVVPTKSLKTFVEDENEGITEVTEQIILPYEEYMVINFAPTIYMSKARASGGTEVEYYFKIDSRTPIKQGEPLKEGKTFIN